MRKALAGLCAATLLTVTMAGAALAGPFQGGGLANDASSTPDSFKALADQTGAITGWEVVGSAIQPTTAVASARALSGLGVPAITLTLRSPTRKPHLKVTPAAGTVVIVTTNKTTAAVGELITLRALFYNNNTEGTVTFRDEFEGGTFDLGTADVRWDEYANAVATLKIALDGTGVHSITAFYNGDGFHEPGVSDPVDVTIRLDDSVKVEGLGVSATSVYPYRDGYRDKVAIRGTPGEPVSVSIKIRNSYGKVVRSWALAKRTSKWSVNWNGRKSSGARLANGKYKIVQKVRDGAGNVATSTRAVALSNKRAYFQSRTITRTGANYTKKRLGGSAFVSRASSAFPRGIHVYSPSNGAVAVWWGAYINKAQIYGKIKFAVLGKGKPNDLGYGVWKWKPNKLDPRRRLKGAYKWYTMSAPADGHILRENGRRYVVGMIESGWSATSHFHVKKVKITYTYGYLR